MERRLWVWVALVALMASAAGMGAGLTAAQQSATPVAAEPALFAADGISTDLLAVQQTDMPDVDSPRLRLEQLTPPRGLSSPVHTAGAAELLVVERGSVLIADTFGFSNTYSRGESALLTAGAGYSLSAAGQEPTIILRLSLANGQEETIAGATPVAGRSSAAPVAASPIASPIAGVSGIEQLLDAPIALPAGPQISLFVGRATWQAGASTGKQTHDGPVGLFIEQGTLGVASPSGLTGQVAAGKGVVLPANAPLQATNQGTSSATALVVGIATTAGSLFTTVVPTPVPTTAPTVTPVIAKASVATATPTVAPTATPEAPAILQLGQTWKTDGATLTVAASDVGSRSVEISVTYENLTSSRADFKIPAKAIRVYDDQRQIWTLQQDPFSGDRVILDPGESITYKARYYAPSSSGYSANVFVAIDELGLVQDAKWGFTFDRGRVLTLPPNAVDPTVGR